MSGIPLGLKISLNLGAAAAANSQMKLSPANNNNNSNSNSNSSRASPASSHRSSNISSARSDFSPSPSPSPSSSRNHSFNSTLGLETTASPSKPRGSGLALSLEGVAMVTPNDPSPTPRHSGSSSAKTSSSPHIKDIKAWEEWAYRTGKPSHIIKQAKTEFYQKICSKIYDFLFMGGDFVARNYEQLTQNGITHVLNVAGVACADHFPQHLVYKTLDLFDGVNQDIVPYFWDTINFIEEARAKNGKVYVHCHQGISRSSSFVIAYMMWYENITFQAALEKLKDIRTVVSPNDGFSWRLLSWQKVLTEKKPRLFRISIFALNSERRQDFIPIECPEASSASLDPRTAFVLHLPTGDQYLWYIQGQCNERVLAAAKHFSSLLTKLWNASPVIIIEDSNSDAQSAFWDALGGKSTPEKQHDKYPDLKDLETILTTGKLHITLTATQKAEAYASVTPTTGVPLNLGNLGSFSAPPLSMRGTSSNIVSPASDASSDRSNKSASGDEEEEQQQRSKIRLYGPYPEFERLKHYDADDLQSDSIFFLLCHYYDEEDEEEVSRGECYVWVGSEYEDKDDEDKIRSAAEKFLEKKSKLDSVSDYNIIIEHQDNESDEFFNCFDNGE